MEEFKQTHPKNPEDNSFDKDEILKSLQIFEVSRKRENKDDPKFNDAQKANGFLIDLKTLGSSLKESVMYEKAADRLAKTENKEALESAILMNMILQILPAYIQEELNGEPATDFGENIKFLINNSKFLKREYNQRIFDIFAEAYIYDILDENKKDYFARFLEQNPSFSRTLDQLKESIKEYDETSGVEFERIANIKEKLGDFERLDLGQMGKSESDRFVNEFLDKGETGVNDLKTMKDWLESINKNKSE